MTPEETALIASKSIEGATTREIAAITGYNQSTIVRAKNKPDIKAIVEKGISQLLQRGLTPSINTHCRLAAIGASVKMITVTNPDTGKTYKTTDIDPAVIKLSLDASKNILSHANGSGPQTVINQLILQQSSESGGQETSALAHYLSDAWSGQIIDVTPNCIESIQVDKKYPDGEGKIIHEGNNLHVGKTIQCESESAYIAQGHTPATDSPTVEDTPNE